MKKISLQPGAPDLDVAVLESIHGGSGGISGGGRSAGDLAGIIGIGGSAGELASIIGVGNLDSADRFSTFVGNGRFASGSGVNNGLVLDHLARGSGSVVGTS